MKFCPCCKVNLKEATKQLIFNELDKKNKTAPELSFILKINVVSIIKYLKELQKENKIIQLAGSISGGGRIADIWQKKEVLL